MKLFTPVADESCYVYSTSYRFCIPFTFAPFTTVAPINRDFSNAVSFMWNRKDRDLLGVLHASVCKAVEEWTLFRLYRLSVLACGARGSGLKSRQVLRILAMGAKEAGDTFPFDEAILSAVRSYAPTLFPDRFLSRQARDVWSKWPSGGYGSLAQCLNWRSTLKDYLTNQKWQSKVELWRQLGSCHRCGKPQEKGVYCQKCYDEIFLEGKDRLDRRLAAFD